MMKYSSRRQFLKTAVKTTGAALFGSALSGFRLPEKNLKRVGVYGHLWVYASRYPPTWDCNPVLEQVFRDFSYAGIEGVEMMDINLRHNDIVTRGKEFIDRYKVPVTGSSYNGNMWNKAEHSAILDDVELVLERLHQLGGKTFGITVGNARRIKTETELDHQADLLTRIIARSNEHGIQANIHNHTFEVENNMHDLRGILKRIPDIKLGPDLNWLVRGGVDPVTFIQQYGKQMVYMHIRDQDASGKWTESVGDGVMDFPSIAKALKEINYSGNAAIELAFDSPPVNEVRESWKKSREYVRRIFEW